MQERDTKTGKWKIMNLNPTAPTLRGLLKVHKEGAPIKPVVNRKNTTAYNLAQMLEIVLSSHTPPFTYNVKNKVQLMDDLLKIPQGHLMKLASLDISSIYSNIQPEERQKSSTSYASIETWLTKPEMKL